MNKMSGVAGQTLLHYFRSRKMSKSKTKTKMDYLRKRLRRSRKSKTFGSFRLPDDIVFDILIRLPAQDLHSSARLVCRSWYKIVRSQSFVQAHLRLSPLGLFSEKQPLFIATRKGRIEISEFNYHAPRGHEVVINSSCNGLTLITLENYQPCIWNPTTNQHFALPHEAAAHYNNYAGSGIAYAATRMKYKVVRVVSGVIRIMTVGVDKDWKRRVNTRHLSHEHDLLHQVPFTTRGFLHWAEKGGVRITESETPEYVLSLNIETETIRESRVPCPDGETLLWYYYLTTGTHLTLLICGTEFLWEVWEMEPETGEWTKLKMMVDLRCRNCKVGKYLDRLRQKEGDYIDLLRPVGWLGEVLLFNFFLTSPSKFIAYNVRTHEASMFKLKSYSRNFCVHTNSLVWLD